MYKIVFVVAVFAFALQGALSSPVAEIESAQKSADLKPSNSEVPKNVPVAVSNADEVTTTTTSPDASTTSIPKSGASSTEICLLLVQVSSLALVAKHMLL